MQKLFTTILAGISFISAMAQQKAYYRMPALHENLVLFTTEGDLWKFDMTTNQTMRLTSHQGMEYEAVFSPDGKSVAFTGEYEGMPELYTMSAEGGVPKRVTFENWRGIRAISWLPDGKILYTTRSQSALDDNQLAKLDPNTLVSEIVPLSQAADGCYSGDGLLYFTRFAFQGSHTKRYKGGTAQNIWKFQGSTASTCITCDFTGTSKEPMIYNERIYFSSDRDGTMNIWSMDTSGKDLKQHTFSSGWDIFSPSIYKSRIVFQKGADIVLYDIEAKRETVLDIRIHSDFDQRRPRWIKDPEEKISYWEISPSGKFVAVIARGRIFVSPASGSRWVEATRTSGIRHNAVSFLDEKNIVYLSDQSGEVELWKMAADGSDAPKQLTKDAKVLITGIFASPDGKYVAYSDKDFRLMLFSLSDGLSKLISQNDFGNAAYSVAWSKDSHYLIFSSDEPNTNTVIRSYEIRSGKTTTITTDRLNSFEPQFSSDNKWLYFISDRELKSSIGSPWGARQPEAHFEKTSKIYALAIDGRAPFPFGEADGWSDKLAPDEEKKDDSKQPEKKSDKKATPTIPSIDWPSVAARLYELPLDGRNIARFRVAEDHLYWTEVENNDYSKQKLYALKIQFAKKFEPTLVADDIGGFDLSGDKNKLIVDRSKTVYITDADGEKLDLDKSKLDLSNWAFQFDPVEDWRQMFVDAWRLERDYFYDRNLHGVDWVATRKRYESLLPRVTDRYELDQLISQMVSELSALHIFVYGGDKRRSPDNIQIGSLGARLVKDPLARGWRIKHIYQNDPDYPLELSPLAAPNIKIREGDVLLKINDSPIGESGHMNQLLSGKIHMWVKLTLQNVKGETYDQLVKPITQDEEVDLRYAEWELTRRQLVEKQTLNQVGYVHLRAMGTDDMNDFVKQFYPVFNRGGLILDVRHNGGGNIDSWVLEKLMRKAWFYWQPRIGQPYWNMQYAFRGHIVVLCDESTGSDGEAVTEGIRALNLGKVIGTRTWGGEIWLSSSNRLVDSGIATAAEHGVYADGKWLIEGHGVDPDIVIDNEPYTTFQGSDAQLDAAIRYLKEKLQKEPIVVPKAPAYPDKSFKYKE
jgi:tricorn protease